jgi:oxygen-independent coproporphyrinogen-3 oxidase
LLDGLDAITGFRDSAVEVTAECNPESLDEAKAACLLELGVDRLSIGVQSLDPAVLELFARPHRPEDGPRALRAARAAGAKRLSADLIYGHPGQELETWEAELREILALRPDHLSAYNLTYEPGTVLGALHARGGLDPLDEERELELFHAARRLTLEHGYEPYEVSNYSLPGQRCAHNVNYWRNGAYVGIGPSAVSKSGRVRCGNPRSLERWSRALRAGVDPTEWTDAPDRGTRLAETWWLGLRLAEGVSAPRARRRAGLSPDAVASDGVPDPAEALAIELVELGLLERDRGRYRLSTRGLPLADAVAKRFLARCAEPPPNRGTSPPAPAHAPPSVGPRVLPS